MGVWTFLISLGENEFFSILLGEAIGKPVYPDHGGVRYARHGREHFPPGHDFAFWVCLYPGNTDDDKSSEAVWIYGNFLAAPPSAKAPPERMEW